MFCHFLVLCSRNRKVRGVNQAGFGLIELLVSISIMVIVASIILVRHNSFNSAILLRNQAYQIALHMREVQLSAISASGEAGDFRAVLGLYFTTSTVPPLDNGHYQVFKDTPSGVHANGFYDTNAGEEYLGRSTLDDFFEIREIRADGVVKTGPVSVVFIRPNFDALFFDSNGKISASEIEIDVARRGAVGNTSSVVRTIEITSTGQISVL